MSGPREVTSGCADAASGTPHDDRHSHTFPGGTGTMKAWERFVAGEEIGGGLRPDILASWLRCRDQYNVDPWRERAPCATDDEAPHALQENVVLAELAGVAKSIVGEVDDRGGLVAVADGRARILTVWGDRRALQTASESNLAPWSSWSEPKSGTNALGTALESDGAAIVRESEHWCAGFHAWTCAAIAIRDPITGHPLGILEMSSYKHPLPDDVLGWLGKTVQPIEFELQNRARRSRSALLSVFEAHSCAGHGLIIAADNSGRLVAANDEGRSLLAFIGSAFGTPTSSARLDPEVSELSQLIRRAVDRARADSSWVGYGQLILPARSTELTLNFRSATAEENVVGLLITSSGPRGEHLSASGSLPRASGPTRILAIRARRLILLSPSEICFAEADGNMVWIHGDQGRIRAFARGLGVLEEKLRNHGFLRVHRRFLVNLARIREIVPSFKGGFGLIMDTPSEEFVPVSRRRMAEVRAMLGL